MCKAVPEYVTAKIAVWWDMKDCPVPDGYDACRIRPSIEGEFKKLGYYGPVSITAYADQRKTRPRHLLRDLSSTGIAVAHTVSESTYSLMFKDMLEWRTRNPPPATMMIISDHVETDYSWFLSILQLKRKYNLFLAYSSRPYQMSLLVTSAEWLWESLLAVSKSTVSKSRKRHVLQKCTTKSGESTGLFRCRSCFIDFNSLANFRMHLSSKDHEEQEECDIEVLHFPDQNLQLQQVMEFNEKFRKRKLGSKKAFRTGFGLLQNQLRARKSQTCKKES